MFYSMSVTGERSDAGNLSKFWVLYLYSISG